MARKKPIPKNWKVKSGGHVRVHAGCRKNEEDTPKYVIASIGHSAYVAEGVQWYVLRRRKIKKDERKTKKGEERTMMDDQQLDRERKN